MANKNIWLILLVVVGVIVAFGYMSGKSSSEITVPNAGQTTSTGVIVTTNPTIAVAAADAQQSGSSVGNALSYSFDGGAFVTSPTTAVPGQKMEILVTNNTAYHNAVIQGIKVEPSTFPLPVKLNKNATVTENIYTTTGLVITNGLAATGQNQTDLGNGASYNLKDEMTAAALTSTQDMVCIIEITAGVNATTSPSGALYNGQSPKSTSKPTWYSVVGGNSNVYLFDVPALSTSATSTNTIQLNSKSTGRFPGTSRMIKSCYTKEWFVDSNSGKLTYDVADSNGNLKSMAVYTYTVYFQ